MPAANALPQDRPADLAATIGAFETFAGVEPAALEWLVAESDYVMCPAGEDLFPAGSRVDHMDVIVRGRYRVLMPKGGRVRDLGEYGTGYVTGVLPFSRMEASIAALHCLEDTYVLRLHRDRFTELVGVSYRMAQNLVAAMSNRIREFSDIRAQDEKMMSLGKMSAGLAHELNNPAAAIVRAAEDLHAELHNTPESFKGIMMMRVSPEEVDGINAILFARLAALGEPDDRSAMERLEASEALEDWLDDHDVDYDDDTVESFAQARFTVADLERIDEICGGRSLPELLAWIGKNLTLETLTAEIREASARISELVHSVKTYTHMDRDAGREATDLHEGLRSTLTLLKHKLKDRDVTLVTEFAAELPPVRVWGGQINQVYTNLIDNAIDAAAPGGTVTVRTSPADEGGVCVEVIDDGPGVPAELRERIFDPFFTTKDVGRGTGMGLDIARKIIARHDADLALESEPGRTVFRFCLR